MVRQQEKEEKAIFVPGKLRLASAFFIFLAIFLFLVFFLAVAVSAEEVEIPEEPQEPSAPPPPTCTENEMNSGCGAWSACVDGFRSRSCTPPTFCENREGIVPIVSLACLPLCAEGDVAENCDCTYPREILGGRCTGVMQEIRNALAGERQAALSSIAQALRGFLGRMLG